METDIRKKGTVDHMDDSVRNMEIDAQGLEQGMAAGVDPQQKAAGQPASEIDAEQKTAETPEKGEAGLRESAPGQKPEVKRMNPTMKYGRRMDYKTAKVNDKQIKDLNLSLSSLPTPPQSRSAKGMPSVDLPPVNLPPAQSSAKPLETHKDQDEPKSALELELEALEANKASSASSPIPNPLPTPKKRVPKEMEYDIEPPEYAMHFDLVDMDGKDFFDIN